MKTDYSRIALIKICEKSFVPQSKWADRDSASAQLKMAQAYCLLKDGCTFKIIKKEGSLETDEDTIWLRIWRHDFSWFEYGGEGEGEAEVYYLPTPKRLKERKGGDWY